jgi:VanZ family protein
LLRWLLEVISPEQARSLSLHTLEVLHIVARKMGHVTEYAILTILAVRAIQFGEPRLKKSAFFGAFLLSALFACSDEFHQRFVPGRGASPIDVAIDLTGVTLVMVGIVCWFGVKSFERNLRRTTNDQ